MRRILLAALTAAALAVPVAATAQSGRDAPGKDPRELLEESGRALLRMLEVFMQSIPQYSAPEVLENGDIIIRRKNPPNPDKREKPSKPDEGPTRI